MKKITLLSILFLCALTAGAQFKYGPRFSLGSSSLGSGSSSLGFQGGLFLNAEIRDKSGVQFEVLYSVKKGAHKYKGTNAAGQSVDRKDAYSFTYIDIPLYFYFPLSKHIVFLVGPQFSVLNKATVQTSGSGVSTEEGKKRDVAGADTKAGIAAGLDFDLSSPLRLGLRFTTTGGEPFKGQSSFVALTAAYTMSW